LRPKGIRVSEEDEERGLDLTQHSEMGYSLEYVS
jgi:ammonia channel protein AmtB